MSLIVVDKNGRTDGVAANFLSRINSPIPLVLISKIDGFEFNDQLQKLDKYCLVDFSEMGWNYDAEGTINHVWGHNTLLFDSHFDRNKEYNKFCNWVRGNPPTITFKRELLKRDATDYLLPIEFPAWHNPPEFQTKKQFDARPIEAFFFWGRSHEDRLRVHGEFWTNASRGGYSVCDNIYFFNQFMAEEQGRKRAAFWMPHYGRVDIQEIFKINGLSKISLALWGAGRKTFRHMEASYNAAMLTWNDNLAWTFPWVDGFNCIMAHNGDEVATINRFLDNPNLYDIYRNGVETSRLYFIDNYTKHIEKLIQERV